MQARPGKPMTTLWVSIATSMMVLAGPAAALILLACFAVTVGGLRFFNFSLAALRRAASCLDRRKMTRASLLLPAIFTATAALAADADNGKQMATARCMPCHESPSTSRDVAQAMPFDVLARKFAPTPQALAFRILDPHPRMNLTLTRREAEDIAAYINTLAK
jgi:hypothetical protein